MKVAIIGSRSIDDFLEIQKAVNKSGFIITEVISGGARGIDRLAQRWASINKIPITIFKPDWNKYTRGAGFVRNRQIVDYAEALLAIWDGKSKGTEHSIKLAKTKGIYVYIHKA